MTRTVADFAVESLKALGVRRVYGVVGDSLNAFTDALRRNGDIDWIHMRHEEAAAFAAGAEAHLTGTLAVCAGSCGPATGRLTWAASASTTAMFASRPSGRPWRCCR